MSIFEKQDRMADNILKNCRGKVLAIVKATRAGATTSLLKQACKLGQKTVIVAPFIEIFETTVKEVADKVKGNRPTISRIPANREVCVRIIERIREAPRLNSLPFHYKPSCNGCKYNSPELCELQSILDSEWDILGLTYAKLRALHTSSSDTASQALEKLKSSDNLILDEFVTGIITANPSMEIDDPYSYLEKEFDYQKRQMEAIEREDDDEFTFWGGIAEFAMLADDNGKNLKEGGHEIYENSIQDGYGSFFEDSFAECWRIVELLTSEGKNTEVLQKIVQIIPSKRFLISKKRGKVSISAVRELDAILKSSDYLKDLVSHYYSKNRLVALVDACLPDLNLSEALTVPVNGFNWGDPLGTNRSQVIICDTRRIGEKEFYDEHGLQQKLINTIRMAASEFKPNRILIMTLNRRMTRTVEAWKKAKQIPPDILVTYYRSDWTRGITVDPNRRILVLIGAPYLPQTAYLAETLASGTSAKTLQGKFKKSDMRSTFINSIGRVKDPEGKIKSAVYALGVRDYEVKALVKQTDVPSPSIVSFPVQGARAEDFAIAAELFLHVENERWKNLEGDLPILARAVRKCIEQKSIQCGEIVPKQTERVQKIVQEYSDILEHYDIKTVTARNGSSLVHSKS